VIPLTSLSKRFAMVFVLTLTCATGWSKLPTLDREQAQGMLESVASDVRKYYYDPKLRGIDWDAQVGVAKNAIALADSWDVARLDIAALLEKLNDSHTYFVPPPYPIREDYGWQFQMVGDRCYVVRVRPKSDAEAKGLKPGDEVLTIEGFTPTRVSLPKIEYVLHVLRPMSGLEVGLRDSAGKPRLVNAAANVRQTRAITDLAEMTGRDTQVLRLEHEEQKHLMRPRYKELDGELLIVKFPAFFVQDIAIDEIVSKARKHKNLILDLRGNGGGPQATLQRLLGGLFDHEVKIADIVSRDKTTSLETQTDRRDSFSGNLIVLVDSASSSASELLAKVVQIQKRGTVLGDRTSGRVMEAKFYPHQTGSSTVLFYGAMVSAANLIMTDGKSLENVGVTPDQLVLPAPEDLRAGRDPVMAKAVELAGAQLSPEDAGKIFPYEWPAQ